MTDEAIRALKRQRVLAYVAFALVCTVWGTTYLGIRVAIETLPTFLFAGFRFTIAGAILLVICRICGQRIPKARREWINAAIPGLLMVGVGNIAVVWAEHSVTSGFTALLVATSPFWMAMLELRRGNRQTTSVQKKVGMIIGFCGVAILVWPELFRTSLNVGFLAGVVVLQLGSIAWNLGSIRSKYQPVDAPPLVSAAMQMLIGGTVLSVIGLLHGELPHFYFTTRTLVAFLYLLVFGAIVGYSAYVYALSKLPTAIVSLYAYVNPAVAVLLGWLILHEPLGWRGILAMAVILSGVALVQTSDRSGR